jgi:hypothetical protein
MLELHPPPVLSVSQAGLLTCSGDNYISIAHKQLVCGSSARTTLQERRNRTTMADGVCSNQHTISDTRSRSNAEPYIMQKIWSLTTQYAVINCTRVIHLEARLDSFVTVVTMLWATRENRRGFDSSVGQAYFGPPPRGPT